MKYELHKAEKMFKTVTILVLYKYSEVGSNIIWQVIRFR